MKTKSKLFAALMLCCALVLAFTACAGCTGSDPAPENTTPEIPVANTQSEPKMISAADLAGTWYSSMIFVEDDDPSDGRNSAYSLYIKLELNPDGTGAGTWYNNRYAPYMYNTLKVYPLSDKTLNISLALPLDYNMSIVDANKDRLTVFDGVTFTKTPWDGYTAPAPYPTPEITKEHNPADYIEDGNYYLEDDNGRSFTDTLWAGDVAPYVAEYKSLYLGSKLSESGSQAGEWIKFIRSLSDAHHPNEPTDQVLYQTIDETMNRGYGTCDDLAILAARGLKELGYNVSILVFPDHMDLGIAEEDYNYFHNYLSNGRYSLYHTTNNKFGDYYYLDITDYQHILDIGDLVKDDGSATDMALKKIIPL